MRKLLFNGLVVLLLVGGAAAVADALVVTDEEKLEAFADALSGDIETARIDHALDYLDPDREGVEVSVSDEPRRFFDDGQGADLAAQARHALEPFLGDEVELLQKSIELDGDQARVALRLRTPEGLVSGTFDLVKHGERWYVSRARLR